LTTVTRSACRKTGSDRRNWKAIPGDSPTAHPTGCGRIRSDKAAIRKIIYRLRNRSVEGIRVSYSNDLKI